MPSPDMTWLLLGQILIAAGFGMLILALVRLSGVLKEGLGQINRRTHEPFVTVSLEASAAGQDHVNLVVENCGFAPAFDVRVTTAPGIPAEEGWEDRPDGWHDASLLRPGHAMVAYACRADRLTQHEILVEVSWKNLPNANDRASLKYCLDMRRYPYQAGLAPPPALDDVASELRQIRRDWRLVARGERPMRVEFGEDALAALRHPVPQGGARNDREALESGGRQEDGLRRDQPRDAEQVSFTAVGTSRLAAPAESTAIAGEIRRHRRGQGAREHSAADPRPSGPA